MSEDLYEAYGRALRKKGEHPPEKLTWQETKAYYGAQVAQGAGIAAGTAFLLASAPFVLAKNCYVFITGPAPKQ